MDVIGEGLGSTATGGVRLEFVELIECVLDLFEAQGLGFVPISLGRFAANDILKLFVVRKLER